MSARAIKRPGALQLVEPAQSAVVTQNQPRLERRVVNVESLDPSQLSTAQRYINASGLKGTLVGALTAKDAWDVRPLLLQDGELTLLRFSNPEWIVDQAKMNSLRALYVQLDAHSWLKSSVRSWGESQGQLWIARRFYQATLDASQSEVGGFDSFHPVQQIQQVITMVGLLHDARLVHGHICPANFAFDGAELVLLDMGFGCFAGENSASDLAPEIVAGLPASAASDIYGIGVTIRSLASIVKANELQALVERCLLNDPKARPTLAQVREAFGLAGKGIRQQLAQRQSEQTTAPAGKVLDPKLLKEQSIAAPTVAIAATQAFTSELPRDMVETVRRAAALAKQNALADSRKEAVIQAVVTAAPAANSISVACAQVIHAIITRINTKRVLVPFIAGMLLVVLVSMALLVRHDISAVWNKRDSERMEAQWLSSQPSLMLEVAKAALENDSAVARNVIIRAALQGKEVPRVRATILRTALNPVWEAELSGSDRANALRLALAALLPDATTDLPPLPELHPTLLLALLAESRIEAGSAQFAALGIEKLAALPAPLGSAFDNLSKLGARDLADPQVVALAHIVSGDLAAEPLDRFFSERPGSKLLILFPLFEWDVLPGLEQRVLAAFDAKGGKLAEGLKWFDQDNGKAVEWANLPKFKRMVMAIGALPEEQMQLQNYGDLLRFPHAHVRAESAKAIAKLMSGQMHEASLQFLASEANRLTRFQTIALISAFAARDEKGQPYVSAWFNTQPDPQSVLSLLVARNNLAEADLFNFEASRYLVNRIWRADAVTMRKLSVHPEPLARALALSRLDLNNPAERKVLEDMAVIEPNSRIRDSINEKLGTVLSVGKRKAPAKQQPLLLPEQFEDPNKFPLLP